LDTEAVQSSTLRQGHIGNGGPKNQLYMDSLWLRRNAAYSSVKLVAITA
jgi:hypothetical protein